MSITGYEIVHYTVVYRPGYSHVKPGTLEWDAEEYQWRYETVSVPREIISGAETYRTPLGKKIIWAASLDKLVDSGSGYTMTLPDWAPMYFPGPMPRPPWGSSPPYPQPEVNPKWENPPVPEERTSSETFVIAHATSEIEV